MEDLLRKVVDPEEGEEAYLYLVLLLLSIVGFLAYNHFTTSSNT